MNQFETVFMELVRKEKMLEEECSELRQQLTQKNKKK